MTKFQAINFFPYHEPLSSRSLVPRVPASGFELTTPILEAERSNTRLYTIHENTVYHAIEKFYDKSH